MAETSKKGNVFANFWERIKTMLKVDFRRMFTQPLFYIMLGVAIIIPVLVLVMTTMMGGESVDGEAMETFTNVWQAIGTVSSNDGGNVGMSMDLTAMCNINLMYFALAVLVCVFTCDDFRSGYAKNIFAIRSKRSGYVASKTIVGFVGGACLITGYFIGAMIGGKIAGLSFELEVGGGEVVCCLLAKIFIVAIFSGIFNLASIVAKQRLWLSILLSLGVGMFLFAVIPMVTPLNSTIINVVLCLAGGILFSTGVGVGSVVVLNKTSIV